MMGCPEVAPRTDFQRRWADVGFWHVWQNISWTFLLTTAQPLGFCQAIRFMRSTLCALAGIMRFGVFGTPI
jgi:hypothetical protein